MRRTRVTTALVMAALAVAVVALRGCGVTTADVSGTGGPGPADGASVATSSGPARPAAAAPAALVVGDLIEARVSKNVDGDTIHVTMPDGADEKVRFIGVNTPESTIRHEPYGKEASNCTKRRLPVGTPVWLETDVQLRDTYGRILAYVWLAPPTDRGEASIRAEMFNAELLLQGYADLMTIPPDVKYVNEFRPMAAEARNAGRGLWGLEP
jgi:endonuclease YncB( thermonuclease family)